MIAKEECVCLEEGLIGNTVTWALFEMPSFLYERRVMLEKDIVL